MGENKRSKNKGKLNKTTDILNPYPSFPILGSRDVCLRIIWSDGMCRSCKNRTPRWSVWTIIGQIDFVSQITWTVRR